MPGIVRSRRQPRSWSGARRSTRPRGDLARGATSASARAPDRSSDSSRAGARGGQRAPRPARRAAGRGAAPAPAPDDPPLDRGRALGLDQLLADRPRQRLERLRPPARAQERARAHGAPEQWIEAEPCVEGPEVVVDAEGEAHPRDALLGRRRDRPPSAANRTRSGAAWRTRTTAGSSSTWSRRVSPRRRRAESRRARRSRAGGRASGAELTSPTRDTWDAQRRGRASRELSCARLEQVDVDEEGAGGDHLDDLGAALGRRAAAAPRDRRPVAGVPSDATAATPATKLAPATAAAWAAGRERAGGALGLDRAHVGHDRQGVARCLARSVAAPRSAAAATGVSGVGGAVRRLARGGPAHWRGGATSRRSGTRDDRAAHPLHRAVHRPLVSRIQPISPHQIAACGRPASKCST